MSLKLLPEAPLWRDPHAAAGRSKASRGRPMSRFNPDGTLVNPKQQAAVEGLGAELGKILELAYQPPIPERAKRRRDLARIG
ncbi:MAG: hypothetical protein ACRED0_04825 [Gammaproteobacteria bacterium]